MWPMQNVDNEVLGGRRKMSARGRLTAAVLEAVHQQPDETALSLGGLRERLDEVLASDARFPFHLAAYLQERLGQRRVAVALLVESANRVAESRRRVGRSSALPFSLQPIVARVVREAPDAAFAMAYQVRHFGWSMPRPLRSALSGVLRGTKQEPSADDADVVPLRRPLPRLAFAAT